MTRHSEVFIGLCKTLLSLGLIFAPHVKAEEMDSTLVFIDTTHDALSQRILSLSNRLDSFFGDPRIDDETNNTRIRLFNETFFRESAGPVNTSGFKVQLKLPRTERRLQLVVSRDDEDEDNDTTSPNQANLKAGQTSDRREQTNAGIRYLLDLWDARFSSDLGLSISEWPPAVFGRLRARKRARFGKWVFRPAQIFRWQDRVGWTSQTNGDLDRRLSDSWLFRLDNRLDWAEEDGTYKLQTGPVMLQKVSDQIAMTYSAKAYFEDEPQWAVNNYTLAINFRQLLYKEWFFWQIGPYLNFPREDSFHRTPGATIKFEAIFGRI